MGVVAVSSLAVLASLALIRESPDWWRTVRRDDPRTIRAAQDVEDALMSDFSAVRPTDPSFVPNEPGQWRSEPWTIRVEASEANAWLNVRLPKWLANREEEFRWPEEVSELQVDFDQGVLRIGARVRISGQEQIVSATIRPALADDGSLTAPARWVHVGRLAVPASWVLSAAEGNAARYIPRSVAGLPETDAMLKAFQGLGPVVSNAVVRLGDGRRVRLLRIEPRDGALVLTCQTEVH